MNGSLHIHLGASSSLAKAQHGNGAIGAGRHAWQIDNFLFDGHF
jgi:hypothetical protein